MRKSLFFPVLLASALSIPLAAHADTIDQFTFNFPTPPQYFPAILTVDIPASPTPYSADICRPSTCITVVGYSGPRTFLVVFRPTSPTETYVEYALDIDLYGPQPVQRAYTYIVAPTLFTGSIDAPTFLNGTFDAEYTPVLPYQTYPGTITIEPLSNSTVPEPSTFALMATGILGIITTLRYRKSHSEPRSINL